jgi:hypothetical protein
VKEALVGGGPVVEGDQLDLPARDAPGRVDLVDRQLHGLLRLAAQRCVVAGEGLDETDLDGLRVAAGAAARRGGQRHGGEE